jgi:EmrB/QacA subfamily drug resistance transporter
MALVVVCLAQLMIVLDTTIVNVALPAIQRDLHFTQGNLTWVVNAFLVTFGSFLLLAGRLGDLLGRKRVFLGGIVVFTAASALCGLAPSQGSLIAARLIQGVGGALSAAAILAIIVTEFPRPSERARAMSAYVFVAVAGGSLGLLAGGVLTQALSWHWIFFVNLPIGIATISVGKALIPEDNGIGLEHGVDWLGSVLVTVSLMTAVYAIVQATSHGWGSPQVLGFGALAITLMAAFLSVEWRIENPIMPLRILRLRGLIGSSAVRGFLVTGMYSTFFLGTLYLEHVLHYSALQTGLAFLPWTVTVGLLSLGVTARLVARFGSMRVLILGMVTVIIGLALLSTTGVHTRFFPTVFFAYFAIGLGIGCAFMPLLTIAMADVPTGRRSARPRRARHDRHQPLQGARGPWPYARELPRQRLPPRVRRRRSERRGRNRDGACGPANPRCPCGGAPRDRPDAGPLHRRRARAADRAPSRLAAARRARSRVLARVPRGL